MHQTSPGVERAVAGAHGWATRLGTTAVCLGHYVLALLDEDEGRPAALVERLGLEVGTLRDQLRLAATPLAPDVSDLFNRARDWSIRHRHDPEFLTDAFLIAVVGADVNFRAQAATFGIGPEALERILVPPAPNSVTPDAPAWEPPDPSPPGFVVTDVLGEVEAARVLDASFNRAREAARVLEDYCRFALDDRFLTQQVKELRHALAAAGQKVPPGLLLASRDTLGDVGTTATAGGEYQRTSSAHVAAVNLKRLQESLRSLEEFGKVVSPDLGRELETIRYRAYTLERAVVLGGAARERLKGARLYVLLTRGQCVASLDWTIQEAARGGADVFQLREKSLPDRELRSLARDVRRWTRAANALFIVNDRPDIAKLSEADGVHLGQDDLSVRDARRVLGAGPLIGVSTHSLDQLRQAVLDGADYVGIGPTFPSQTKSFDHFPGLEFVRSASIESSLPMFALGGISTANVGQVVAAGARRVAVSSAVSTADEPERAARLLRAALPD
jgi:thiamine-phosphate pyrophosphorylase